MSGFTYKSYNFVDKDPIIDYLRTIINESHLSLKDISTESGVSGQTIRMWLYGETKRPQAASINAVLRSLDFKLDISKLTTPMMIVPTPIEPVAKVPRRRRLGAAKYANVHHISLRRKK